MVIDIFNTNLIFYPTPKKVINNLLIDVEPYTTEVLPNYLLFFIDKRPLFQYSLLTFELNYSSSLIIRPYINLFRKTIEEGLIDYLVKTIFEEKYGYSVDKCNHFIKFDCADWSKHFKF